MALIRVTYAVANQETKSIYETAERYETYGSPEAMWNVDHASDM